MARFVTWLVLLTALTAVGCAKYNTFYNARKAFDSAEQVREERQKKGEDVTQPTSAQTTSYQRAIKKCQKLLEEYPGHNLTDDALFLMAKSYHRMQSYRMSINQLDLLFQNFPASKFTEEGLFLQAANYMFAGSMRHSNDYLVQLQQQFPDSAFQAEVLRVSGDNAFSLEQWERARESYTQFLESFSDDEHAHQVGNNLAHCHWMLGDYQEAHDRLEALIAADPVDSRPLFESRLLRLRCLGRLGRFEEADALAERITPAAEIYSANPHLKLAKAEGLILQGRHEDAAPLLEGMPESALGGEIKPRVGELLGEIYLRDWELEEAQKWYAEAARNPRVLEDSERCLNLSAALGDFVTAEQRLETASENDAPRYKLIKANTLLFHLDRPDLALELYRDIASTAEIDSALAVRGLYGAAVVYRDRLAMPDSAAVMIERLRRDHPDSPQAHMLDPEGDQDLYAFLMEKERLALEMRLAESEEATVEDAGPAIEPGIGPERDPAVRQSHWRERKLRRNS